MILDTGDVLTYLGKHCNATSQEAAVVELLQPLVEGAIIAYLRYNPVQSTRIEYLPATGVPSRDTDLVELAGNRAEFYDLGMAQDGLQLNYLPVRSITSVYENPSGRGISANFTAGMALSAGSHFWLDVDEESLSKSGLLYRVGGSWPMLPRSVKVTYVGGYTEDEFFTIGSNIRMAILLAMAKEYQQWSAQKQMADSGASGPIVSERLGDYAVTYESGDNGASSMMKFNLPEEVRLLLDDYRRLDV